MPLVLDDDYYEHVEKQVSEEICLIDESSEAEFSESGINFISLTLIALFQSIQFFLFLIIQKKALV